MRDGLQAAASGFLVAAAAFAVLAGWPLTRTWGTASYVSGTPVVMSASDAVGVLSIRILLALGIAGVALLAASMLRRG